MPVLVTFSYWFGQIVKQNFSKQVKNSHCISCMIHSIAQNIRPESPNACGFTKPGTSTSEGVCKCVLCYSTVLQYRDKQENGHSSVIYNPLCISESCSKMDEDLLAAFAPWLRNLLISCIRNLGWSLKY